MKIHIKKISELPDALHPNNIPVDWEETFNVTENNFEIPVMGKRFLFGCCHWSTSAVQGIIDDHTFRTLNSIYKWEIVS